MRLRWKVLRADQGAAWRAIHCRQGEKSGNSGAGGPEGVLYVL